MINGETSVKYVWILFYNIAKVGIAVEAKVSICDIYAFAVQFHRLDECQALFGFKGKSKYF